MCSDCVCARRPGWTEATVTDRCARSTKVKSWHINRWRPGGLNSAPLCRRLSPACPRPHTITHTDCQLLHQVDKPFSSSGITDGRICLGKLRLWRVGKTGLFVPPCFSLFLFLFFRPPSPSVLEGCPVQQLPLAVRLKMIGFILWREFTVGQVLPWDPSQDGNLLLHTL